MRPKFLRPKSLRPKSLFFGFLRPKFLRPKFLRPSKFLSQGSSDGSRLGRLAMGLLSLLLLPFGVAGRGLLGFLETLGKITSFGARSFSHIFRPPIYWDQLFRQLLETGYYSLPVIALTVTFSGMVLVLQSYAGFDGAFANRAIPELVVLAITRELGPVLSGLMVAGRVGGAMAAELATMRVSEQIDALETLSAHPYKYLIVPRLLAGAICLPLLVIVGDSLGVLGGTVIATYKLGFNGELFLQYVRSAFDLIGFMSGVCKAFVFGILITLLSCYNGFFASGGAQGVGRATTNAVVSSSIAILVFNYFLTEIFFAR